MLALSYPKLEPLLQELLVDIQAVLGNRLVALYLFGSLVGGDFDPETSDIDLMAVVATDIEDAMLPIFAQMHAAFEARHPFWDGRVEVGYVNLARLQAYPGDLGQIVMLSPGEPLHRKDAGTDWIVNRYVVQEKGVALFGPPPGDVIPSISKDAFRQAVKTLTAEWRDWVIHTKDSRPYQGFAILTMVRALYAVETGEQPSKIQAARWALSEHPELADEIQKALRWRDEWRDKKVDPAATYPETEAFVHRMVDFICSTGEQESQHAQEQQVQETLPPGLSTPQEE